MDVPPVFARGQRLWELAQAKKCEWVKDGAPS